MTIEERAKEYADNFIVGDAAIIVDLIHNVVMESYVDSAKEQQKIDIEKAWRIYNMPVCGSWTKESFTKAMKGE